MLCYWGETVRRQGLGLVKDESVKCTGAGTKFFSPESRIRDASIGNSLIGFIHDEGQTSVLRLNNDADGTSKIIRLKKCKLLKISCGGAHAVFLTHRGGVYFVEQSFNYRLITELSSVNVVQVACGKHHSMALADDGQLFTWGQNNSDQLGLGYGASDSPSPQVIRFLSGVPLAQISAGGEHSVVLSVSGTMFSWGKNSAGQLGLGHTENVNIPTHVTGLSDERASLVSCGEEHTATLSKEGRVYTFGSGRYGQLGHNSLQDEFQPRLVSELQGAGVSQITCGRYHTVAFVESSKTIYSFGRGDEGQQGNGLRTSQCAPVPVALPSEVNVDQRVRIIAGGNHSIIMCSLQNNETLNQRNGIKTLESRMINRWVTNVSSWKKSKKEIKIIVSSAACWNAGFSNASSDGHAIQTSSDFSDLDLESVRTAFEQLPNKHAALELVEMVVRADLLPSLRDTVNFEEALRVFLILPELIRVLNRHHRTNLTALLAKAIMDLPTSMTEVLERCWSKLPDTFLQAFVELFHNEAANLISQILNDYRRKLHLDNPLSQSVMVLQRVYKACCSRQREVTSTDFIIHEVNDLFDVLTVIQIDLHNIYWGYDPITEPLVLKKNQFLIMHTISLLVQSPCVLNLEAKCNCIKFRPVQSPFRMTLRRTALLEDCFKCLRGADENMLKGWLQVLYSEDLKETQVNMKDFFHNVFKELVAPESGMFMYNDTNSLIWFPSEPTLAEESYFMLGILCGLAFNNVCVIHAPFPIALFKKLLDISPSLEDLADLSPCIAQSLRYILNYPDDDTENMDLFYTIEWNNKEVELDPEEPGKPVTSANKNEFVAAYVDYVLNSSVERIFETFKRGFYAVCSKDMVRWFKPEELRGVLVGSEDYDWNTFKKKTTYEGQFDATHPTIIAFWEVFDELSDQDKKAFLLFLTGFDQVPILGMELVKMMVRPLYNSTLDHLPQALTCHAILELPFYPNKKILQPKLIEAVKHKRGFWQE